ncbi:hypothetical protein C6P78_28920 [Burkholderia multivorans]|nr:hypothetical protein C6P78_28920 [Burkholderia multivorans]
MRGTMADLPADARGSRGRSDHGAARSGAHRTGGHRSAHRRRRRGRRVATRLHIGRRRARPAPSLARDSLYHRPRSMK